MIVCLQCSVHYRLGVGKAINLECHIIQVSMMMQLWCGVSIQLHQQR